MKRLAGWWLPARDRWWHFRLFPGFGSERYAAEVLCLCSTANIVTDNMIPPPVQRMTVLLTAQGCRYQINLPSAIRDSDSLLNDSWLHNSGKLIVCQYENTSGNRGNCIFMWPICAQTKITGKVAKP